MTTIDSAARSRTPATVSLADEDAVRRVLIDTPFVFAGPMWEGLVDWAAAQMLRPGFELANAEDMNIPRCVANADQAVAIVREHHARWQAVHGKQA